MNSKEIKDYILKIIKENTLTAKRHIHKVQKVYFVTGQLESCEKDFWDNGKVSCIFLMVDDEEKDLGIQLYSRTECDLAFVPEMNEEQLENFISTMFYGRTNFYRFKLIMDRQTFVNKILKYLNLL